MKRLALLLLLAASAFAQSNVYSIFREEALSSAATALTIQQPASPSKNATILAAMVYCSAATTVTLEHSGTAASSNEITPDANTPGSTAATIRAFSGSNVGVGTTKAKYSCAAGQTIPLEFSGTALIRTAAANYTLRIASMTGTVYLFWMWRED